MAKKSAVVDRAAVTAAAVGRAPKVKGTALSINDEIFALVSVHSGARDQHNARLWIDSNPLVAGEAKEDESGGGASFRAPRGEKVEEPDKKPDNCLHYLHEKLEVVRELNDQEVIDLQDIITEVKEGKGIMGKRIVPARTVYMCAHEKTHFLDPAPDDDSLDFYSLLYNLLYDGGKSLVGEYVSGNTRTAMAIIAEEVGLVMWQLPRPTKIKNIRDHITQEWRKRQPSRHVREAFSALMEPLYSPHLIERDIADPIQVAMKEFFDRKRAKRQKVLSSTAHGRRSLLEALRAATKPGGSTDTFVPPTQPR